jgi:hypothetical protein
MDNDSDNPRIETEKNEDKDDDNKSIDEMESVNS